MIFGPPLMQPTRYERGGLHGSQTMAAFYCRGCGCDYISLLVAVGMYEWHLAKVLMAETLAENAGREGEGSTL